MLIVLLAAMVMAACGGDDDDEAADTDSPTTTAAAAPTKIALTAKEYAFDVPSTIKGGTVEIAYSNAGKEPHFAAFAKAAPGKTFADVKAALLAPPPGTPGAPTTAAPAGPAPFEEYAGMAVAGPGVAGSATVPLAAGTYALFCALPAPDGKPHHVKGMIQEVTVTEGARTPLPKAVTTFNATDFALSGAPVRTAGSNIVGIRNTGKQAHEVHLIELNAGKKIEDVVAWFKKSEGPPPAKFLTGPFVKPGEEGTGVFELRAGATYSFICAIPDELGDREPHVTKGMYTPTFQVT